MIEQCPLFLSGEGGYHTYRIPALAVSAKGTLLAFCEGRRNSRADDGEIDLLLRRSLDHGRTWGPVQLVWKDGENTIGNPAPVTDPDTGAVWLAFCRNNDRVFITRSADEGEIWDDPREITGDVKPAFWRWYATGPCHGVRLSTGRLLVPCDHDRTGRGEGIKGSHVIMSDDAGASWRLGGLAVDSTDECVAVETDDGSVYLNARSYRGRSRRAISWSRDGGESWSEVLLDHSLVEPCCQASAIRFSEVRLHGRSRFLFSNPASTERLRMTVRLSYDGCRTWTPGRVLHDGPSAYSDLAVAPDLTAFCLYERGDRHPYETLTFARFDLDWLEGADEAHRA